MGLVNLHSAGVTVRSSFNRDIPSLTVGCPLLPIVVQEWGNSVGAYGITF